MNLEEMRAPRKLNDQPLSYLNNNPVYHSSGSYVLLQRPTAGLQDVHLGLASPWDLMVVQVQLHALSPAVPPSVGEVWAFHLLMVHKNAKCFKI